MMLYQKDYFLEPCGEEEIRKLQDVLAPEYQIKIFSAQCCNFLTFQGDTPSEKVLHIYHDVDDEGNSGHFIVLSKPHVLFNRAYWCDKCNQGFNTKDRHRCICKCYSCFSLKECPLVQWKKCDDCVRWFRSEECFQKHKSVAEQKGIAQLILIHKYNGVFAGNKRQKLNKSLCEKIRRCKDCNLLINYRTARKVDGVPVHNCGLYFCQRCDKEHSNGADNECFMQPIKEKKGITQKRPADVETEVEKMDAADRELLEALEELWCEGEEKTSEGEETDTKIFYDFECRQEEQLGENKMGPVFVHRPNLCVALKVCNLCKEMVKKREFSQCPGHCGQNEWVFAGPNCRDEFCNWLFSEDNRGSIALAHNNKGYDSQFVTQYLIKETLIPTVISKGRELMMLQYGDIKVIDSLNFLPMGLADLPKAFGQEELHKGFFPHKFNKQENENYIVRYIDVV